MTTLDPTNPFAAPSTLPYGLPDFTAIRTDHYRPALIAGMAAERAEVEAIATDPAEPTVENTLVALERSGHLLHVAATVFYNVASADSTDELAELEEEIAPLLAAHQDAIFLDQRLFARVDALMDQRAELALDADTDYLLTTLHTDF
ncbi:peptidase M3, partial [Agrobacterium sp. S2]|nr:peptidase M3 [Agrobacterium sp. S2]